MRRLVYNGHGAEPCITLFMCRFNRPISYRLAYLKIQVQHSWPSAVWSTIAVVFAPCPHLRTFTTKEIVKDRVIETALRSITVQNLP
jgi:hypothetical protein